MVATTRCGKRSDVWVDVRFFWVVGHWCLLLDLLTELVFFCVIFCGFGYLFYVWLGSWCTACLLGSCVGLLVGQYVRCGCNTVRGVIAVVSDIKIHFYFNYKYYKNRFLISIMSLLAVRCLHFSSCFSSFCMHRCDSVCFSSVRLGFVSTSRGIDSCGWCVQSPSQGWPSCMDVLRRPSWSCWSC